MFVTGQEQDVARIDRVSTVEVIAIDVIKGNGTPSAPYTAYTQFWTKDNHFIGEALIADIGNYTINHCINKKSFYKQNKNGDLETVN